ncbi:MAG: sodium:proton antiporter [Acidobacteriota bacterium]
MDHSIDALLVTTATATFLGISAQVVAHRFKLPAILPLLVLGMAFGPQGVGLFDPSVFGHGLEVVIHLGVAVILFEGGLSLDPRQLRTVGGSLRNLLTIGMLVTWVGAATVAHYATGISWSTAALFGAIVTVTGPTVIAPLLRHMVAPKKVRTLLLSEGLMIDPIGVVLAYLVLQWIERANMGLQQLTIELATLTFAGTVLGYVAGMLAVFAVKRRSLPEELRNLVILSLLVMCFLLAEMQAPQSGILAAVVMGLTVSAADIPDLSPLKAFKGQLTVLIISVLFVLLSGQLDLEAVRGLGWEGALVVAGLIFVVRPLAVLLSIPPTRMPWKDITLLGLTAPRGIVAAAFASLSAIQLRAAGDVTDAAMLEGLVYLVILATCTWATVMAGLLPRWLGYLDDPSRRRIVLVGVNGLTDSIARLMLSRDWFVVVVDSSLRKLAAFRGLKITTVSGDARDAQTYERAGVERDTRVLALTTNDELNLLVADLVRNEFGVDHPVVSMQQQFSEFGSLRQAWVDLLGNHDIDLPRWSRRLEDGAAELLTIDMFPDDESRQTLTSMLRERPKDMVVVCGWRGGRPVFEWTVEELDKLDEISLLIRDSLRDEINALLAADESESVEKDTPPESADDGEARDLAAASETTANLATGRSALDRRTTGEVTP